MADPLLRVGRVTAGLVDPVDPCEPEDVSSRSGLPVQVDQPESQPAELAGPHGEVVLERLVGPGEVAVSAGPALEMEREEVVQAVLQLLTVDQPETRLVASIEPSPSLPVCWRKFRLFVAGKSSQLSDSNLIRGLPSRSRHVRQPQSARQSPSPGRWSATTRCTPHSLATRLSALAASLRCRGAQTGPRRAGAIPRKRAMRRRRRFSHM